MLERRGHFVFHYNRPEMLLDDLRDLDLRYDVAIVDRELSSSWSGDDLIHALREKYPRRPIVSISCYSAKAPGTDAFLGKPFSIDDLVKTINELVRR